MCPSEVRRHQVRVVQIRQRRVRVGGACVEDGLRERFQRRRVRLREAGRQRERVVDKADGVAIAALQPPADLAQPRHVHRRSEQREDGLGRTFEDAYEIARDDWRFEPAYRDVLPTLGADLRHDQERCSRYQVDLEQRRCVGEGSCRGPLAAAAQFSYRRDTFT